MASRPPARHIQQRVYGYGLDNSLEGIDATSAAWCCMQVDIIIVTLDRSLVRR